MKHYRLFAVIVSVVCLTLALTVSLVQAQTGVTPNGPTGGGGPGPVVASFTYQGRLKNANGPVTGNCDFQFSLWDQSGTGAPPTGGIQIGSNDVQSDVKVTDGLFDVVLNFGNAFGSTAFQGDARWLQISVRCPSGGIGLYTVLSPRQPLWATPYAMSLMPGATIRGSVSSSTSNGVLSLANTSADGDTLFAMTYSPTSTAIIGMSYDGPIAASQAKPQRVMGGGSMPVGVYGLSMVAGGTGVMGAADGGPSAKGIYGASTTGYAGYFAGNVRTVGTLTVTGNIYGAAKYFLIDHPLDPANKYLVHTSVESPDMKNVYDGVAVLDKNGEALVTLPDWFEALNRDFRYQLTCIGGYAPVYIAEEVHHNTFKIAGGKPGLKVSWQITGIRQDPWANDNRVPVESDKPASERGTYLYPEGYGQTPEVK
jgi:hypothetical protein